LKSRRGLIVGSKLCTLSAGLLGPRETSKSSRTGKVTHKFASIIFCSRFPKKGFAQDEHVNLDSFLALDNRFPPFLAPRDTNPSIKATRPRKKAASRKINSNIVSLIALLNAMCVRRTIVAAQGRVERKKRRSDRFRSESARVCSLGKH
jgi:hypothetical protein